MFSKNSRDLGRFTLLHHRIRTYNEDLKFQEEEDERTLTDMLEAQVIKPPTSDWASAPVLVRKKDGEVSYTVDYGQLNIKTVKDAYPLPLIEECIDTLACTLWCRTLDLASCYWQILVVCRPMQTVNKTRTTPYHPSLNGQVERYNQMVLSFIRCYLVDKMTQSQWDKHLPTLGMSTQVYEPQLTEVPGYWVHT